LAYQATISIVGLPKDFREFPLTELDILGVFARQAKAQDGLVGW